jgi:hypothetical protein
MHAGNNPHSVQNMAPPEVKQAAYGETRTAIIKKKLMKNKKFKLGEGVTSFRISRCARV